MPDRVSHDASIPSSLNETLECSKKLGHILKSLSDCQLSSSSIRLQILTSCSARHFLENPDCLCMYFMSISRMPRQTTAQNASHFLSKETSMFWASPLTETATSCNPTNKTLAFWMYSSVWPSGFGKKWGSLWLGLDSPWVPGLGNTSQGSWKAKSSQPGEGQDSVHEAPTPYRYQSGTGHLTPPLLLRTRPQNHPYTRW